MFDEAWVSINKAEIIKQHNAVIYVVVGEIFMKRGKFSEANNEIN